MKIILFANTDWYLYNFRLDLAKRLMDENWEVVFMSPVGSYTEEIKKSGFRHIPISFSRKGINPFTERKAIAEIEAIYSTEKPDIVHQFTIKCVIYGSFAAKKCQIKAVINSITGLGYVFLGTSIGARVLRAAIKQFYKLSLRNTQVLFENPDDRKLFIDFGLTTVENSHVILGTGIDTDLFLPSVPPQTVPLTVLPARMLWDKGIGEFVEAATILKCEGLNARFALVGKSDPGNPSSISYDQLTKWQKEGFAEWWGWQDDIYAVLSMADIICLPSYREGLPKILIEAAACARPLVTTDAPGCREVVVSGKNGLLVPIKDAASLADALRRLINDEDLRIQMGEASRHMAENVFSSQKVCGAILAIYQKALKQHEAE